MSKHSATVARKNCLLIGRNLGAEPGSMVGGHLPRPVGLRETERDREIERETERDRGWWGTQWATGTWMFLLSLFVDNWSQADLLTGGSSTTST